MSDHTTSTQPNESLKEAFNAYLLELQTKICTALERVDGKAKFIEDKWQRPEGGGGISRVISNGNVFEKGGLYDWYEELKVN